RSRRVHHAARRRTGGTRVGRARCRPRSRRGPGRAGGRDQRAGEARRLRLRWRSGPRTPLPRPRPARERDAPREPGRRDWRPAAAPAAADRRRGPLMLGVLQPIFGAMVILAIAFAFSTNRRAINWTTVGWGLSLQVVFALIVLKTAIGQRVFSTLGDGINKLLGFSVVGSGMVFGPLGDSEVWRRLATGALGPEGANYPVLFAFQVLPTIIFIAALFAILYYYGIMQVIVRMFAVLMHRVMRASGAESLNVAASIFMGQ